MDASHHFSINVVFRVNSTFTPNLYTVVIGARIEAVEVPRSYHSPLGCYGMDRHLHNIRNPAKCYKQFFPPTPIAGKHRPPVYLHAVCRWTNYHSWIIYCNGLTWFSDTYRRIKNAIVTQTIVILELWMMVLTSLERVSLSSPWLRWSPTIWRRFSYHVFPLE